MIVKKEWNSPLSEGGIAIVGLPGIANTGRIAALTIMDQIKYQRVMDIYSIDMPPRVLLFDGVLEPPRVFIVEDPDARIVVVSGNYQPLSPTGQYELSAEIAKILVERHKVKMVIALAAEGTQSIKERKIKIATTHKEMLEMFPGAEPFAKRSITGANALIPTIAGTIYSIPSACLLATSEADSIADYKASALLVSELVKVLKWPYKPEHARKVAQSIIREMNIVEKKVDYIIAE